MAVSNHVYLLVSFCTLPFFFGCFYRFIWPFAFLFLKIYFFNFLLIFICVHLWYMCPCCGWFAQKPEEGVSGCESPDMGDRN